jgi:phospholipid/cholesterol/gamma-HCH transport system substrate-binding protein
MQSRIVEIWVGVFVALGFAALLMLAMQVSNLSSLYADAGYEITARFRNIGGLKVRSPIKMAGVRIGRVSRIDFDNKTYEAIVTMNIERQYDKIPIDTSASILTAGLLGEQYIGLEAGGEAEFLVKNSELNPSLTQSAVVLEQLIGKFLYNSASSTGTAKTN